MKKSNDTIGNGTHDRPACSAVPYGGCAKFYPVSCKTICRRVTTCCCLMADTPLSKIKPSLQCVPAVLSPGLKWPGRETVHSPLSNAGFKKEWRRTYAFPYVCMACT
jgi:hypothetical protein